MAPEARPIRRGRDNAFRSAATKMSDVVHAHSNNVGVFPFVTRDGSRQTSARGRCERGLWARDDDWTRLIAGGSGNRRPPRTSPTSRGSSILIRPLVAVLRRDDKDLAEDRRLLHPVLRSAAQTPIVHRSPRPAVLRCAGLAALTRSNNIRHRTGPSSTLPTSLTMPGPSTTLGTVVDERLARPVHRAPALGTCPADAVRVVGAENWRGRRLVTRDIAAELAQSGLVVITTQRGEIVDSNLAGRGANSNSAAASLTPSSVAGAENEPIATSGAHLAGTPLLASLCTGDDDCAGERRQYLLQILLLLLLRGGDVLRYQGRRFGWPVHRMALALSGFRAEDAVDRLLCRTSTLRVEPPVGIEPTTYALQERCSTTELGRPVWPSVSGHSSVSMIRCAGTGRGVGRRPRARGSGIRPAMLLRGLTTWLRVMTAS